LANYVHLTEERGDNGVGYATSVYQSLLGECEGSEEGGMGTICRWQGIPRTLVMVVVGERTDIDVG
jgi:hypothetical protein